MDASLSATVISRAMRQNQRLRNFTLLGILAAVLSSAVVYPFRLPNTLLGALDFLADANRKTWGNVYFGQLRSIVAFNHAPLTLKECVSSAYLIIILCFFTLYKVRSISLQWVNAYPTNRVLTFRKPFSGLLRQPLAWAGIFLLYAAVSALLWSPTPYTSLWTLTQCAIGFAAFAMVVTLRPSWQEIVKFMVAVALVGGLISFVSFLQHIGEAWWFLPRFDDPRNRVGSLIGHNTGLSAYLLFPISFACGLWFVAKRRITRVLIALGLLLMLFVIVAAQSRAIWPIGSLMVIAEVVLIARALGRRLPVRRVVLIFLALFLALAALQSVAPEKNPLARHSVRIAERIRRDLSPKQLIKETRLRILIVSLPLIAESPIVGHGLGSFQYVYPPAHGKYFLKHPDSRLGTTVRRTDVAHNDYLQLLVELGVVGGLLLATALILLGRRLSRAWRSPMSSVARILMIALLAPVAAIAAHAAVDFPFHVHPIAITSVFALSLAYSGAARILQESSPEVNASSAARDDGSNLSSAPAPASPHAFRLPLVAATIAVAAAWLASPLAFEFFLRTFISDALARDADNWVATARQFSQSPGQAKFVALENAKELYRRAIKIHVFNGAAMEGLAAAHLLAGTFDYVLWQQLSAEVLNPKAIEAAKQTAIRDLTSAVTYAKLAAEKGELRYHYIYYVIGQSYHLLAKLSPDKKQEHLTSARRAFEEAVAFNNADVASLQELAEVYEQLDPPDISRAQAMRRRIFEVDPEFGTQRYLAPIDQLAQRGQFAQAWRAMNKILDAVGDHWAVLFAKARLYLREALWPPPPLDVAPESPDAKRWFSTRYALAKEIASRLTPQMDDNPLFKHFRLQLLAAGGETTQALELADKLLAESRVEDPELDMLRYELAQRAGLKRELRWLTPNGGRFWYYRQRLRVLLLGPVALGSGQLANIARSPQGIQIQLAEGLRAAAYLSAAGQWDLVLVLAEYLAEKYPDDPDVQKLRETAQAKTQSHK